MKNPKQLVLQFKIDGHGSEKDFDGLVEIEEKLNAALQRNGEGYVDGHDIGSGEMNIYIIIKTWERGTWFMEQYLKNQPWNNDAILAKDLRNGSYKVLWPKRYEGDFAIA
ncbi:MAG: hypothetical protein JJU29_24025 [Verrucomicrobia bacterium]|nr:hypothetical protein [Verrucomicrobiota bacterium]